MEGNSWFEERSSPHLRLLHHYKRSLYSARSTFQEIDIIETYEYGLALFLDKVLQSAEADEYIYHEMIVHPSMYTHPAPKKVLIIGGAEGATLREVLRHDSVEKVVMVDIDEELVNICKKFLPSWSKGSFDDPRLSLIFDDGRKFLEETNESFDVIIVDLSDPIEDSPSVMLFTKEFYKLVYERLSHDGTASIQAESMNLTRIQLHARIYNTLKEVFPVVLSYPYVVDSYNEIFGFILVSKEHDPRDINIDKIMKERKISLNYYSAELHKGLFYLPKPIREAYKIYNVPITDKNPALYI